MSHLMVKSTVEISQNFVAFSEYMNFKNLLPKNPRLPNSTFELTLILNTFLYKRIDVVSIQFTSFTFDLSKIISTKFVSH